MLDLDDTIAAVASAAGGGARGIVRVSGAATVECLRRSFRVQGQDDQSDGCETYREFPAEQGTFNGKRPRVYSGELRESVAIPCDLYVWPTRRSYTRQPAAEVHTLGSPPLLEIVLRSLCWHGARLARPGEFTLRAFLAGRLDLMQAEAVLATIDAENERELNVALDQLAGGLSAPLGRLRGELLDLLADLEAGLDFVGEDIQFIAREEVIRRLSGAENAIDRIEEQVGSRGASLPRRRAVLAGWPNVGKSSLFNALTGREAAIVSPQAGTTRDYLQAELEIGIGKCLLIDTAGFGSEAKSGGIDAAAQQLASQQRTIGDVVVLCLDASRPINEWEEEQLAAGRAEIVVWTKCEPPRRGSALSCAAIETSALNGRGLDELRTAIARLLDERADREGAVASTAARCGESLECARQALEEAIRLATSDSGDELVAAAIRSALGDLGRIAGEVYTEDLLDRIFSRFCIGK